LRGVSRSTFHCYVQPLGTARNRSGTGNAPSPFQQLRLQRSTSAKRPRVNHEPASRPSGDRSFLEMPRYPVARKPRTDSPREFHRLPAARKLTVSITGCTPPCHRKPAAPAALVLGAERLRVAINGKQRMMKQAGNAKSAPRTVRRGVRLRNFNRTCSLPIHTLVP